MSSRGQSLSVFVVQRTFTRVRRGYDPDEVDQHLERVSRWFTGTETGEAIAAERAALDLREQAIAARELEAERVLSGARAEAEATLEGARRRADAEVRAAEADRERIRADVLAAARGEAEVLAAQLRAEAEALAAQQRAEADRELAAYVERRRREADRVVEAARRTGRT
jgi:DivIVA domain-containing protein